MKILENKKIELGVEEGCMDLKTLKLFFDEDLESDLLEDIDNKVHMFVVNNKAIKDKIKLYSQTTEVVGLRYEGWNEFNDWDYSFYIQLENRRIIEEVILICLKDSLKYALNFQKGENNNITIYLDNDFEIILKDDKQFIKFNFTIEIDNLDTFNDDLENFLKPLYF